LLWLRTTVCRPDRGPNEAADGDTVAVAGVANVPGGGRTWTSSDGEVVAVTGEQVFDADANWSVAVVTVRMPPFRAEHLASVIERWSRICELVGGDSDSEATLAEELAAAARSARAFRDAQNAG